MSYRDAASIKARGFRINFAGTQFFGARDLSNFGEGGTISEIDVTDLTSDRRIYEPGLADGGTISVTANALPHTPVFELIRESNVEGVKQTLQIYAGGIASGERETDGRAITLNTGVAAGTGTGPTTLSLSPAGATALAQGVVVGDYVTDGTNTAAITAITAGATAVSFTLGTTGISGLSSGDTVSFIRPAILWTIPCYVSEYGFNAAVDGVIEAALSFRVSGESSKTLGTAANDGAITIA